MHIIRKIIPLVVLFVLNWPIYATQSEGVDDNTCRTTSRDWVALNILFPGKSLGEALVQLGQDQSDISVILGGVAPTPIGKAQAIQALIAVNQLPTIQPPLPANYPAYPYVPLNVSSDLVQAISQLSSAFTFGGGVNLVITLIGLPQLPPTIPLPIPYPYVTSGIIETDLTQAIGQVDITGGVSLGQAITNTNARLGLSSTHPSVPVIANPGVPPPDFIFDVQPPNRVSSGIIKQDIITFHTLLSPVPALSLGLTYQSLMDRFAVFFRDGGAPNVIAAGTTLPGTLDEIMTALGI